ncbi:uncharacterized protein METZ01_LOCUS336544, partial [marine metagenome]
VTQSQRQQTPGAAQDGIKRHDDGKVLHNAAESGTQRYKTAHDAAQVHSLPSALAHDGSGAARLDTGERVLPQHHLLPA